FFFYATSKAHAETALSHLFRLIDKSGSGVHIQLLLDYVAAHPELCDASARPELLRQIRSDTKRLAALSGTIDRLRKQRNRYFAHLSREYLAKPERQVLRDYAVGSNAVSDLLDQLAAIINGYSGLFRDSTSLMQVVGEEAKVDHLLDQLETAAQEMIASTRRTHRSHATKALQPTQDTQANEQGEPSESGRGG